MASLRTYPADGFGPPCDVCGQRIAEQTMKVAVENMREKDMTKRFEPVVENWVNQPCGHTANDRREAS